MEKADIATKACVVLLMAALAIRLDAAADHWVAEMRMMPGGLYTHAEHELRSSSALAVEWDPPKDITVFKYRLVARQPAQRQQETSAFQLAVDGDVTRAVFQDLKAATLYEVRLEACLDPECEESIQPSDPPLEVATEAEYWRIQGTGNSYATAARLVPDGNVGSYAFRYGSWAGEELEGRIQLYYNPSQRDEKGMKIAELVEPRADSVVEASAFRGVPGFGLLRVCGSAPPGGGGGQNSLGCAVSESLASQVALFQAVPLAGENPVVRVFFEAQGKGQRTRILYLDSQDGYVGRDFNRGTQTICATLIDFEPGGDCEPALAIGVDIDGEVHGNPNLRNARQFKILYPMRESTAWDQRPGTAMWFTTEWPDGRCSRFGFNQAYAVWNGERWVVQYDQETGCPKLLAGAQAAMPVHLGGARYKVYFNRHARPGGPTDPQVALKPLALLYADPARSGDPDVVDFEDWEAMDEAREVHFLWPDGSPVSASDESKLDDFVMLAPNPGNPAELIMYTNMSSPGQVPFIGSAVLINP